MYLGFEPIATALSFFLPTSFFSFHIFFKLLYSYKEQYISPFTVFNTLLERK